MKGYIQSADHALLGLINARSLMNKWDDIVDHINDHNLDLLGVTDTWIPASLTDLPLTPPTGYSIISVPRPSRRGGGIALLYRSSYDVLKQTPMKCVSYEMLEVTIRSSSRMIRLIILYRPPPSKKNGFTVNQFIDEFENLLENKVVSSGDLVVIGDFNFHWDNPQNVDTVKIRNLMDSYSVMQHVTQSTHTSGHILDWVITPTLIKLSTLSWSPR